MTISTPREQPNGQPRAFPNNQETALRATQKWVRQMMVPMGTRVTLRTGSRHQTLSDLRSWSNREEQ